MSHSIAVARVHTCLSNALKGFPVSRLVVVIDHVWTIQNLCLRKGAMASHSVPQKASIDDAQNHQLVDRPDA